MLILNDDKKKLGYVQEKDNIVFARYGCCEAPQGQDNVDQCGDLFDGLLRASGEMVGKLSL